VAKHRPITGNDIDASNEVLKNADKSLDNFASFQDDNEARPLIPEKIVSVVQSEEATIVPNQYNMN